MQQGEVRNVLLQVVITELDRLQGVVGVGLFFLNLKANGGRAQPCPFNHADVQGLQQV